jgi:hypothetical protein
MAERASWKGFLRLSLVACPVQLFNAITRRNDVSFHLINPKTSNRIQMRTFDPEVGEVERSSLVRGFELAKNKYVVLTNEDLAPGAVRRSLRRGGAGADRGQAQGRRAGGGARARGVQRGRPDGGAEAQPEAGGQRAEAAAGGPSKSARARTKRATPRKAAARKLA